MEPQQVSRYRKGKSTFDDTTAARIAELLGVDAGFVAACMNAQRAQTPQARKMWERAAKTLASVAAAVLIAFAMMPAFDITIPARSVDVGNIHYATLIAGLMAWVVLWFRRGPGARATCPVW